jgi:hypothetical protein
MTCRAAAVAVCLLSASAVATAAQGLTLVPSIGTSVVYDDNLFQRPDPVGDFSVRFSPRLEAARQSQKLAISSRFALDADRFAQHPELSTARARQDAAVDARYSVSLGPRSDARFGYTVTSDTVQGGVSVTTQTAAASIEGRVSERTRVNVEYLDQYFVFGGSQTSASHAITAEWTRELNRGTTLALRAGPRVTRGVLAPEIAASARHLQRAGDLSLSYQQTQTTLIGLTGVADVKAVTAAAERELWQRFRLVASSGVLRTRLSDGSSLTYRFAGTCAWTLARGLAVEAGYDADRQRGNPYAAQPAQNIRRNRAMVTLVVGQAAGTVVAR